MDIFHAAWTARLIFSLGIINIVTGLFVFFTCRCLPGLTLTKPLMQYAWYKKLYKLHCYVWWIFWISVIVHAVFAIGLYAVPF